MKIYVNGAEIEVPDNSNIVINGDQMTVNGSQSVTIGQHAKLEVVGGLANLTCDRSVTAQHVAGDVSARGSVNAGDVGGSVKAGGSVNCGRVSGDVKAGGSVNCTR